MSTLKKISNIIIKYISTVSSEFMKENPKTPKLGFYTIHDVLLINI